MAASEMALGEDHPATRTTQPAPAVRKAQLSEIAHHKDGDLNHGFNAETTHETPGSHDHNPDA